MGGCDLELVLLDLLMFFHGVSGVSFPSSVTRRSCFATSREKLGAARGAGARLRDGRRAMTGWVPVTCFGAYPLVN